MVTLNEVLIGLGWFALVYAVSFSVLRWQAHSLEKGKKP